MYMHIHMHIHTCTRTSHAHTHLHMRTHTYRCTHTHTYRCTHMHTCTRTCTREYMHARMYMPGELTEKVGWSIKENNCVVVHVLNLTDQLQTLDLTVNVQAKAFCKISLKAGMPCR